MMGKSKTSKTNSNKFDLAIPIKGENLCDRVVSIIDNAKSNVVKSVNSNMTIAYWLIGREIVIEIQNGSDRAEYGKNILADLSRSLKKIYGKGFSVTNLRYFRLFYQTYSERSPVIRHKVCDELNSDGKHHKACDVLEDMTLAIKKSKDIDGFSPFLSWSHYRTFTQVENKNERLFYEIESENEGWSVPHLERQIHTFLFARLLKSKDKKGLIEMTRKGQVIHKATDIIKNPYILNFLDLPESNKFHESKMEKAIIDNIQAFLLELGKGFAFVARQKRISTDQNEFYIDLVFYNFYLKCFVLIDLKTGKLTHQDVGQMDMYIRMYDELERTGQDNPTVGLILCRQKDKAIVKYSVMKENKQIFASKYMLYLPSEQELAHEIEKDTERK